MPVDTKVFYYIEKWNKEKKNWDQVTLEDPCLPDVEKELTKLRGKKTKKPSETVKATKKYNDPLSVYPGGYRIIRLSVSSSTMVMDL